MKYTKAFKKDDLAVPNLLSQESRRRRPSSRDNPNVGCSARDLYDEAQLPDLISRSIARVNAKQSDIRLAIEHDFAGWKHRMALIVSTISMDNLVRNFQRLTWLESVLCWHNEETSLRSQIRLRNRRISKQRSGPAVPRIKSRRNLVKINSSLLRLN